MVFRPSKEWRVGCCSLITVTELSRGYASVWKRTFPFISKLVRKSNLQKETFEDHLTSGVDSSRRAIVNEIAFRVFEKAYELDVETLEAEDIKIISVRACKYIADLEKVDNVAMPNKEELKESILIAERTKQYFIVKESRSALTVSPRFNGCGMVSFCFGDVLSSDTLYEIKAGEREFRAVDLKQLLIYVTLNFSEHDQKIKYIALLNPRLGSYVKLGIKESVEIASGKAPADAFYELINFFDNPDDFR